MSAVTLINDAHFWIGAGLVVVLVVFWRLKVPDLLTRSLDEAGAKVQAQLDEATRLRAEAETLLEQIKIQNAATHRAAEEMMAAALKDAERLRTEAAVRLEEDIKRRGELAERKIAIAEAQAANEVRAAAADLAAQAAETVLAARIAGAVTDPLIDAGLANLGRRFA
jgi:F-type H+-transporting ATPase subunit b